LWLWLRRKKTGEEIFDITDVSFDILSHRVPGDVPAYAPLVWWGDCGADGVPLHHGRRASLGCLSARHVGSHER